MSKAFKLAPSELVGYDADTPKGFYLNRGVWLFGTMLESELQSAENAARKRHGNSGANADKFINSERLRVLGKYLKEDIKRFREPGAATNTINQEKQENVEQDLGAGFGFKFKTK